MRMADLSTLLGKPAVQSTAITIRAREVRIASRTTVVSRRIPRPETCLRQEDMSHRLVFLSGISVDHGLPLGQ